MQFQLNSTFYRLLLLRIRWKEHSWLSRDQAQHIQCRVTDGRKKKTYRIKEIIKMERRSTSCWLAWWLERQLKRWNSFFSSSLRSSRFYCHTSFLIIRFRLIFRERVRVCGCPCSRNRELTLQIIFCECVCLPSDWMEKKQQYAVQVEFLRGECLPIQKSSWICIFPVSPDVCQIRYNL